ncbi:MAG: hypothetical protein ACR2RB_23530, partial [Gammaproteobacteria bacterium]
STAWSVDQALQEHTYYYWRVIVTDEHTAQTVSRTSMFFVNLANDAPTAPGISRPLDGAEVAEPVVELVVDNAGDVDGDALDYLFELDVVPTFDSPGRKISDPIRAGVGTTSWSVLVLEEDRTYYWRVKATDGSADGPWVTASFMLNVANNAPAAPIASNPGNGAWVATLMPTLEVNRAVDPEGDAVAYRFELYDDAGLASPVAQATSVAGIWSPEALLVNNQWYYWRVQAVDESGAGSDWSPVARFFVDDNGVDDAPTIRLLTLEQDIVVEDGSIEIHWDDYDPDSSATISLYYDAGADRTGEGGVLIAEGLYEDFDGADDSYTWNLANLPAGSFSIYAVIDDGNTSKTVYADGVVKLVATSAMAHMLRPEAGSLLTASAVTFEWSAGDAASRYRLDVGSAEMEASGGSEGDIYSGQFDADVLGAAVTGLPRNGAKVYVRLWSKVEGNWIYRDYEYQTEAGADSAGGGGAFSPALLLALLPMLPVYRRKSVR